MQNYPACKGLEKYKTKIYKYLSKTCLILIYYSIIFQQCPLHTYISKQTLDIKIIKLAIIINPINQGKYDIDTSLCQASIRVSLTLSNAKF